jgi:hypothetical protein
LARRFIVYSVLDFFDYSAQQKHLTQLTEDRKYNNCRWKERRELSYSMTDYGYDGISRLTSLTQRFAGNAGNATHSLSYNPASQITQATRDNDAFAFTGLYNVNRSYTVNGPIYLIGVANCFGIWTRRISQLETDPD